MSHSPDSSSLPGTPTTATPGGPTVVVNGRSVSFAGGTVGELLNTLEIKTRAIAVELNQEIVPADQHNDTRVAPGDQLEVVTLVGGG